MVLSDVWPVDVRQDSTCMFCPSGSTNCIMARRAPHLFTTLVLADVLGPATAATSWKWTMEAARTNGARTVIRKLEEIGPDPRAWTADQSQTQSKLAVRMSSDAPNMVYDLMLPALMYDPTLTMQAIRKIDEGMRVRPRRPRCPPTRRRRRSPRTRKPCVRLQQSCDVVRGQDAEKRWSRVLVRGEEVRVALKQTVRPNSPGLGYRCSYTAWTSCSTEGSRDIRPSLCSTPGKRGLWFGRHRGTRPRRR
jgi:hypothetical protein